jgi:adenosylcobinamide-GDP ribazoletransferase
VSAWWNDLLGAIAYFSLLPVPARASAFRPNSATLLALPLVGALIGAVAGGAALAISFAAGRDIAIACALALQIGLTGAIHIDGFLDMCDAAFAAVSPARRLEILKDPHHGTFAVAGMALLIVVWLAGLHASAIVWLPGYLAFSAATARMSAIAMTVFFPYAGSTKGSPLSSASLRVQIVVGLAALMVLGLLISPQACIAPIAAALVSYALARWMSNRLGGGLTGDSYGFLIGVLEPFVLVVLAARP